MTARVLFIFFVQVMVSSLRLAAVTGGATVALAISHSKAALSSSMGGPVKITYFLKHKEENVHELERIFNDVSNPNSDNWGQFLSLAQVAELQQPDELASKALTSYLSSLNIP